MATLSSSILEQTASKASEAAEKYLVSRITWKWAGSAKAVKGDLKNEVASTLDSDSKSTRASTDLYNWKHPALAALRSFKRMVRDWWFSQTVEWTEDGARLIPKATVPAVEAQLKDYLDILGGLAQDAQDARAEIIEEARQRRGRAFSYADYPENLASEFALEWSYSSLTVSKELREISEGAYLAEQARQTARIMGAVQLAEEAKMARLGELIEKLLHGIAPAVPGMRKPHLFGSAVENLQEFCQEFGKVVLWGCDELREAVEETGNALLGLTVNDLRQSETLRADLSEQLRELALRFKGYSTEGISEEGSEEAA